MSTVAENAPADVPVLNVISIVAPRGVTAVADVMTSRVRVVVVIVRLTKPLFAGATAGVGYLFPALSSCQTLKMSWGVVPARAETLISSKPSRHTLVFKT